MALLSDVRTGYHRALCAEVVGARTGSSVFNIADSSSASSVATAAKMVELIGQPTRPTPLAGQTAGNEFTRITMEFLQASSL